MPATHDLTDDELKEFEQHGVTITQGLPAATANEEPEPAQQTENNEQPRDPATGQFLPAQTTEGQQTPAPAEGTEPAPQTTEGQQTPPPGFVPHAAMHAERVRAQQATQQLALLQARTNALLAARQQPEHELPDLSTDPVGYVRGLEERIRQFEETQAAEAHNRQIDQAIEMEENTFRNLTPDYDQASEYYVQSRAQELLAFYTPHQAQQIMMAEARQMATEAWQRGVPAPQMVYTLAQARGYRSGAAVTPQLAVNTGLQGQPAQNPLESAGGAPSAAQTGTPSPAAVVAAAAQGQQVTRTLSGGSGAATTTTLNAEALLNMSDEEFEQYLKLGTKGANARFAAIG